MEWMDGWADDQVSERVSDQGNIERDEVERHKQDQLKKQKQGQNHWKEELASESESAVRFLSSQAHTHIPPARTATTTTTTTTITPFF